MRFKENIPGSQPTEMMPTVPLFLAASSTAAKCLFTFAWVSKLSTTLNHCANSGVCSGRSVALPPHRIRTVSYTHLDVYKRQDALSAKTAQLPAISLDIPHHVIGKNTIDSMRSGIMYGNAAMLDGLIDRMSEELGGKPTVLATGGLSQFVAPLCRHKIICDDTLLLKGLLILYEKNK